MSACEYLYVCVSGCVSITHCVCHYVVGLSYNTDSNDQLRPLLVCVTVHAGQE